MLSWAFSASWPTNSSSRRGRRRASASSSSPGSGDWIRSTIGSRRADHRRDTFSAWAISASGVSPWRAVEQALDLGLGEAEAEQAFAGEVRGSSVRAM